MADRFELAKNFVASLKQSDGTGGARPADFLDDSATFMVGMTTISGRDAIVQRLNGPDGDPIYRQVTWSKPETNGEAVQIAGLMPPGSAQGGLILLLHFAGDRIVLIQQQAIAGAPPPATELKLTPELQELVNNSMASRHPILVAAVLENGQPVLSYRGSVSAYSDHEIAFWVRHLDGNFLKSIEKNPRVNLFYRDADTRTTLQFQGRARVVTDSASRRKVYEGAPEPERNADFAQLGVAVIVDLDRIEGSFNLAPGGRVLMVRGAGSSTSVG